jgi:hypothetical protein
MLARPRGEDRYRLTGLGRRVAAAEASRLAEAVADARSKHLLPASGSLQGVRS